jgi:indole-3-glycerol phosphate synthase
MMASSTDLVMPSSADLLDAIVAATRRIVEIRQAREPLPVLIRRAEAARRTSGLLTAISRMDGLSIIAECKRRSPSRGVLRADYDPASIARGYEGAGAAAISVLTEPTFFDGSLDHLRAVRDAVRLPILRKDFIVSEYQLLEAQAAGADAVLLIVAALQPRELASLVACAARLGLDALVEVHTADELSAAIDIGSRMIGINNRDLRTLAIDLEASERLIARLPDGITAVSESGLRSPDDLWRLSAMGYAAFLIGERFMTEPDPGAALRGLLESSRDRWRQTGPTRRC